MIEVDASTTAADVNRSVAASDCDVVVLSPDDVRFDAEWAVPLAIEAMRPDAGVVGPLIIDQADGNILSVGRVTQPTLDDRFAGDPADSSGPFGAFFVAREVSALAPWGVAVERRSVRHRGRAGDRRRARRGGGRAVREARRHRPVDAVDPRGDARVGTGLHGPESAGASDRRSTATFGQPSMATFIEPATERQH